jgi:hypothetical protein
MHVQVSGDPRVGTKSRGDFFDVYDLRESKVVRFRLYESQEEALEPPGCRSRRCRYRTFRSRYSCLADRVPCQPATKEARCTHKT